MNEMDWMDGIEEYGCVKKKKKILYIYIFFIQLLQWMAISLSRQYFFLKRM